jgi:hypothetical protein
MDEESFKSWTIVWCNESSVPVVEPVDVESRIFRTRNTSIYELLHLVHEDSILEQHGTLPLRCNHDLVERQVKILTHVRQSQGPRPVHSGLTVDVDDSRSTPKELPEVRLEFGIPVQDSDVGAVNGIETEIPLRIAIGEPLWARPVICTVDDVRDVHLGCEPLR